MKTYTQKQRQKGVIDTVTVGKEDHGILTVSVGVDFKGSYQSFGNLALEPKTQKTFLRMLCATFGVTDYEKLKGTPCYALLSFDSFQESIEGIESMDGKRFTLTGFRKSCYPEKVKDKLKERREDMDQRALQLRRQALEIERDLLTIHKTYIDWETEGRKP